jgi:hypothetical protein
MTAFNEENRLKHKKNMNEKNSISQEIKPENEFSEKITHEIKTVS